MLTRFGFVAVLTDGQGKYFTELFETSQKLLRKIVGLELVLMRPKESGGGNSEPRHPSLLADASPPRPRPVPIPSLTNRVHADPPKSWILRSTLPLPLLSHASSHAYPSLADQIASTANMSQPEGTAGAKKDGELRAYNEWCRAKEPTIRDERTGEMGGYGLLGVVLALILVNGKVLGDGQCLLAIPRRHLSHARWLTFTLGSLGTQTS